MSLETRVLIVIGIVLGVALLFEMSDNRPDWIKPLSDREVAETWLECADCRGPYLRRLHQMRPGSRDSVTQFLRSILLFGPDSAQRDRHLRGLQGTLRADSLYRARRAQAARTDSQRVAFIERYTRGLEVTSRVRAATALGVIRSGTAMGALSDALRFPPTIRGYRIIRQAVENAIADSARSVLAHYP